MPQHRRRHALHVVGQQVIAAVARGGGLGELHQMNRGARAGAQRQGGPLAAAPRDRRDVADERRLDADARRFLPRGEQLLRSNDVRLDGARRRAVHPGLMTHQDFFVAALRVRILDADLRRESIELRFRQRIRALELDGVLRRDHREQPRQRLGRAVDRDLAFLHRLEERGLRPRRHAVDFVHEQEVGEHGAAVQPEFARRHVQHVGADDVGRHQVRRALDALVAKVQDARERPDGERLAEAGHAFEQRVSPADHRQEQHFDRVGVSDDGLGHLRSCVSRKVSERFHESVSSSRRAASPHTEQP